jgi:biopolymer transport protein ExbD
MRFGQNNRQEPESIQLAPLIDIVFLTLVFFMTTASFMALEKEVDITLPTADSAQESERTHSEIYINLREDGKIILNDRELTIPELQNVLNRLAEHSPGGAVIIRGDSRAVLGKAIAILDCCRKADIQNVAFAALTEEPEEGR